MRSHGFKVSMVTSEVIGRVKGPMGPPSVHGMEKRLLRLVLIACAETSNSRISKEKLALWKQKTPPG